MGFWGPFAVFSGVRSKARGTDAILGARLGPRAAPGMIVPSPENVSVGALN